MRNELSERRDRCHAGPSRWEAGVAVYSISLASSDCYGLCRHNSAGRANCVNDSRIRQFRQV